MTITDYIIILLFSLLILFIGLSFSKTSGKGMKSFFAAGGLFPGGSTVYPCLWDLFQQAPLWFGDRLHTLPDLFQYPFNGP